MSVDTCSREGGIAPALLFAFRPYFVRASAIAPPCARCATCAGAKMARLFYKGAFMGSLRIRCQFRLCLIPAGVPFSVFDGPKAESAFEIARLGVFAVTLRKFLFARMQLLRFGSIRGSGRQRREKTARFAARVERENYGNEQPRKQHPCPTRSFI